MYMIVSLFIVYLLGEGILMVFVKSVGLDCTLTSYDNSGNIKL